MKIKITAVALLAVTAGVFAYTRPHNAIPSDLRDAVADTALETLKNGSDAGDISIPEPKVEAARSESGAAKMFKSAATNFSRTASDKGPLFGRMTEKSGQAGGDGLRLGDESPTDVLKRMFEAGTQPRAEDLAGVFEGRFFSPTSDKAGKMLFIGKELEKVTDGGPLFTDKKGLYMGDFNYNLPRDQACGFFKSGENLDPVRIEGGSAISVWREGPLTSVLKIRMNSGYLIHQSTERRGDSVSVFYRYHFGKVLCDK